MAFSIHELADTEIERERANPGPTVRVESTSALRETPQHPLRITLRPNLNHLINSESSISGHPSQHPRSSDRDSLSPPPPITLRLGMKIPNPNLQNRRTSYSSSSSSSSGASDDDEDDRSRRPSKRPRHASTGPQSNSPSSKKVQPPAMATGVSQIEHGAKKTYDWLAPSTVGASHHGPHPERAPKIMGWSPDMDDEYGSKKKSHKKKPDGMASGPGKAWRKGLRKGMAIPWKEGGTFQADGSIGVDGNGSMEGTPEPRLSISNAGPDGMYPSAYDSDMPQPPSPTFTAADREVLGFPVFSKPIVTPIIHLATMPKVTSSFAPDNGGDPGHFPRKEKVRNWKYNERTLVGIGGGKLKFRTWHRGAPSELGRLLAADKQAKDLMAKKPKTAPAVSAPGPAAGDLLWEAATGRPELKHSPSGESIAALIGGDEKDGSEIGDGEESSGVVAPKPKAKGGAKGKGRKSKLAHEILPLSENSSVTTEQAAL